MRYPFSMREIKFRMWDKENEEWIYAEPIYGFFPNIIISDDIKDRYGDVQQYTGLKDKNGKEIYEGDIINGTWKNITIKWSDCDAGFNFSDENDWRPFTQKHCSEIEIIGNIYENKNLIK